MHESFAYLVRPWLIALTETIGELRQEVDSGTALVQEQEYFSQLALLALPICALLPLGAAAPP